MDLLLFGLGVSAAAWIFTVLGTGYALWRYVYVPWKVMRADLRAFNEARVAFEEWVKNEIGMRKALAISDEDLASIERRVQARSLWSREATTSSGPHVPKVSRS